MKETTRMSEERKVTITILVNDDPVTETFPSSLMVEEVIKKLLPPSEKQNWNKYELRNTAGNILDTQKSLADNQVADGDKFSLNKSEGGGGGRWL
jgi:hypothetical protein